MNVEQEQSRSLWMDLPAIDAPPLAHDLETDVLVVGAGIAGLSTAYELALSGRTVCVVDRGRPTRGMTARTSAHLAFELDDYYHELLSLRGEGAARLYYESQSAAVDRIEEIVIGEGIDCDFARVDGYLVPADEVGVSLLDKEFAAAFNAGYDEVEHVQQGPGPWASGPALRFPRQARFHPLKYLYGLLAVLRARGVEIYGNTPVGSLEERNGRVVGTSRQDHRITAQAAVVATNTPFHLKTSLHTRQAPYRTYVVAATAPKGTCPDVLAWDTLDPYHYVRVQPADDHDVLIVGGEDHKTGEADDMNGRLERLERWARERFPEMGHVTHAWSGQVMEPADYMPFIGRSPRQRCTWLVTGDSGQGLTTGVAASLILCEQVNGGEHPWAAVYDPGRSMVHGLREYLSENLGAARHWAAHLGRGDVESADQLPPGQGAIVRDGAHKLAAYRTPTGELRFLSATCTHAGCIVRWNGFENCWDCPCHGSQFSIDGEPLQGPATRPLAPAAATREHSRPRAGAESSSRPTAAEAQREAENLSPRPRANEPGTSADRG